MDIARYGDEFEPDAGGCAACLACNGCGACMSCDDGCAVDNTNLAFLINATDVVIY
jgi:hypothetical protein